MRRLGTARRSGAIRRSMMAALALAAFVMVLVGGRPPSAPAQTSDSNANAAATNGRIAFVLGKATGTCKGKSGDLATANPDGSHCNVLTTTGDAEFPALNPAGTTIGFTRLQHSASAIYVIGVNGKGERKLVSGPASEPTWSPDGSEMAFAGAQSGSLQIYLADVDTGAIVAQLTSGPGNNSQPAWSPDGTQIAFISDRGGSNRLMSCRQTAPIRGRSPMTVAMTPIRRGARTATESRSRTIRSPRRPSRSTR